MTNGRTVLAVIRFTASPPDPSGVSSTGGTGRTTQTPGPPAVPLTPKFTPADVIAHPGPGQALAASILVAVVIQGIVACADGAIVLLVEAAAVLRLNAAQLLTPDAFTTPPTLLPRRPLRPDAINWTVGFGLTDHGLSFSSDTRTSTMFEGGAVTFPD